MIPVMQTKFTDEANGIRGNCMGACVASLLEVPLATVPAWEDMGSDGSWGNSFMAFLSEHGFTYEGLFEKFNGDWWSELLKLSDGVDGYFIIGGTSERSARGHAVIYMNGVMVHDPHPSGVGVGIVEEVYIIESVQP